MGGSTGLTMPAKEERQMQDERKPASKQPEKPIELPDCIAHPTGATCPVEWCRKARGNWCKRNGEWCRWRNY